MERKREMSELKSCPHCGGEAKVIRIGGNWKAVCSACDASSGLCATKGDAIAAWNRRVLPECQVEWKDTLEGLNATAYVNGVKIGFFAHITPYQIQWVGGWFSLPIYSDMAAAKHAAETQLAEYWNLIHGVKP